MVVSLSCDTLMMFTDRWFVSRLGSFAMNAIFVGGLAAFASQTFFTGLIGYSTALVAQEYGAGRKDRCVLTAYQSLLIAVCAWPLLLLLIPLGRAIFPRLGFPASQLPDQLRYFSLLTLGSGLGLLRGAFSGFFSGMGRTRVVMIASLTSVLFNVPLVYVLVFGKLGLPALGVTGAALGTLTASAAGVLVLALAFLSKHGARSLGQLPRFGIDRTLMRELVQKGAPSGLEFLLNMLAFQLMVLLLQRQGEASATAATLMFNWDMVSFIPLIGVEIGVTSMVGRYLGARNFAAVRRSVRSGLKISGAFSAFVFVAFLACPGVLVDVFRGHPPTAAFLAGRPLAIDMLRLASIYVGSEALLMVFVGALRGVGDTFFTMLASNGLHWILALTLWITLELMHQTTLVGWGVVVGIFMLFPLVLMLRWRQGRWRHASVLALAEPVAH